MLSPLFDLFFNNEDITAQLDGQQPFINVSYNWIDEHDPEYAEALLKNPEKEINILTKYISGHQNRDIEFQLIEYPHENKIGLLDKNNIGKLVSVRGVVVMRTEKVARPTIIAYVCPACGITILVEQTQQWRIGVDKCTECDNRRGFLKDYNKTSYDDFQWIEIQETNKDVVSGKPPSKVRVSLRNHRTDSCLPGENVAIIGIYKTLEQKPNTLNLDMPKYVEAVTIVNATEDATITLTDDDITKIRQLMESPDHLENIKQSISPSIYGLEGIKLALSLQLCEGQVRFINETRRRGQFHILLAGSPGCGKSELGDFMKKCHPKGRKAIGRGASAVGLTASVIKEGDVFVLKAGAMPLADNGFLFVDEIEKMSRQDSGAMHPGMEQQTILIDKADISAELSTRCSVLASCNPVDGVWNEYKTVKGNLNDGSKGLALTLLDRFALTFIMKQNLETSEEQQVINHIMRVNSESGSVQPPYTLDMLRKIFAYARTITVTVTKEATDRLTEFYMILYEASKIDNSLIITRRQPNDLLRLAEASARLHGRSKTTIEDAELAIKLVGESLMEYGLDTETGKIDQVAALYGKTLNRTQMIRDIPIIIGRLTSRNIDKTKISRVAFIEYASTSWKVMEHEAGEVLDIAIKDGLVYCPTPQYLAVSG